MRLRELVSCLWLGLLWGSHAALDPRSLAHRLGEVHDLGETPQGLEDKSDGLAKDNTNYAVSGDLSIRNNTAEQRAEAARKIEDLKRVPGPILKYKQHREAGSSKEQARESRAKAALARRMTVKDKIREIGKPRTKTGAVAPVLQTTAHESVVADFIRYGCVEEKPPPPSVSLLGETKDMASDEACDAALSSEDAICALHGGESQLCKQLKAGNSERCGIAPERITPLGEANHESNQTKSCHADCMECVGIGPKKCTSCAELKAFVTLTPGDGGGECRRWPLNMPVARGTRDAEGRLTPPRPDVTTEIHQALTSGIVITEKYGAKQLSQTAAEWSGAPAGITEFIPQCSWWMQVKCTKNKKYAYSTCKEKAGCKDGKKPSWLKSTPEECIVSRCDIKKLARLDRICFRNDKEYKNLCEGWYGQQEEGTARCECYAADEMPLEYMQNSPSWCNLIVSSL